MTSINYLVYILISILILYLIFKLFIVFKKSYEIKTLLKVKEKIEKRCKNFKKPLLAPGIKAYGDKICLSICIKIDCNCYNVKNEIYCG